MTEQLIQQQVNHAAWAAGKTFCGAVDASQYKDHILVMLFLKYISDIHKNQNKTKLNQFRTSNAGVHLPEEASFYNLYEKRTEANIGELINIALKNIEDNEHNQSKLKGVFRNVDFNSESNFGGIKERNRLLKKMLEDFAKPELDLNPSRVNERIIGRCYLYLISQFSSEVKKRNGDFYTPITVSDLLVKLAAPKQGDKICDPACGSGSLLIRTAEEVASDNIELYGQEVHGATWALARLNMLLHSKDATHIEWCNTLSDPKLTENDELIKFDVVVSNPPFGLDKWGEKEAKTDRYKRYSRGIPPKSKGDYAFITHMIEIAKPLSGRVVVVVPHGVLFRGGTESKIREALIKENLLDAVIGLPANLFTTMGIPVAILVFDRSREQGGKNEEREDVLFIDASKGFTPGKNQNVMDKTHIDKVLTTYTKRTKTGKHSYLASIKKITDNEFNLNISRYVDKPESEENISVADLQKKIMDVEAELDDVRKRMATSLKELGVDV